MKRFSLAILGLSAFGALWGVAGPGQAPAARPPAQALPPAATPQQAPWDQYTIRVQSDEVMVPVSVTDDRGLFVRDLKKEDFSILDEGQPQRITGFNHDPRQPVVFGFLVDLSNHSRSHWDDYKEALKTLIWQVAPGDQRFSGYLISYANEAELVANTTSSGETLAEKVDKMKPGAGGSALFDAIAMACTLVKGEPSEPRRVIVIVGDGHDSASRKSFAEALELAKRSQTTIFGLSTIAYGFDNTARDTLEQLANQTGGGVEYPLDKPYRDVSGYVSTPTDAGNYQYEPGTGGYAAALNRSMIDAVTHIAGEVATQYVMRYRPDVDPTSAGRVFRRIKVEAPGLNVKIHARDGYYPNPAAPPADGNR